MLMDGAAGATSRSETSSVGMGAGVLSPVEPLELAEGGFTGAGGYTYYHTTTNSNNTNSSVNTMSSSVPLSASQLVSDDDLETRSTNKK